MQQIEFFAALGTIPTVTAQDHHRVTVTSSGRRIVYRDKSLNSARQILTAAMQPYRPSEPLAGPLQLTIGLHYPRRKTDRQDAWKTTVPDLDNSSKEICDTLTALGIIADDKYIVALTLYKLRSDTPGIYIHITPLMGLADEVPSFIHRKEKLTS